MIVTARIHSDAADYLVNDTRFWVVKPRVAAGSVSGLGTLFSGAYISVDVGRSAVKRRNFVGLEVPPIVTSDLPGREFILRAEEIGSLSVGSTVFYRHIAAGQVVAYSLDPGGDSVTIKVFINKPYDAYVTPATRFWQASGIDMSVDADGVTLRTESLTSILEGGIAYQSLPSAATGIAVPADTAFTLYTDRERAMRQSDTDVRTFTMYFKGSVCADCSVGAPVDLRGITIGEVKSLSVEYDRDGGTLRFPVEVDIFPQRIRGRTRAPRSPARNRRHLRQRQAAPWSTAWWRTACAPNSRRAASSPGRNTWRSIFTPEVPPDHVGWDAHPAVFPTADRAGSMRFRIPSAASSRSSTSCRSTRCPRGC